MIKVVNGQITNDMIQCLENIMQKDVNASAGFKLIRIIKELKSIADAKRDMEIKILEKYVERDEMGNVLFPLDADGNRIPDSYSIPDQEGFTREMMELMEIESTIGYEKMDFESLGLDQMSMSDIAQIEFLFL